MGVKRKAIGLMLDGIIDYRGKTPPKSDAGIPCISAANVKNGRLVMSNPSYVSQETYESWTTRGFPKPGDVIITTEAPAGEVAAFPGDQTYLLTRRVMALQPNPAELDEKFLLYALQTNFIKEELYAVARGTTVPRVLKTDITDLEIPLPPLPEQKAIAHILGTLDDKIELNRRMNETLEGIAQAFFKSWFVDFDPVIDNALAAGNPIPDELADRAEVRRQALANGTANREAAKHFPTAFQETEELGWIPKGWDFSTIGYSLDTVLGGTPARKNADFWQNGTIGWINSGKVNEFRITEPSELITEEALAKSATKLLPKRTTVLAITGATLGQVSLTEIECCANQSVIGILGTERIPSEYIYSWINHIIDKLVASQTGGAQQHINKGNVQEAAILLPSAKALEDFISQVRPAFDRIALGCFKAQTLTRLRDTLLPKLISGELNIDYVEKTTKELML